MYKPHNMHTKLHSAVIKSSQVVLTMWQCGTRNSEKSSMFASSGARIWSRGGGNSGQPNLTDVAEQSHANKAS